MSRKRCTGPGRAVAGATAVLATAAILTATAPAAEALPSGATAQAVAEHPGRAAADLNRAEARRWAALRHGDAAPRATTRGPARETRQTHRRAGRERAAHRGRAGGVQTRKRLHRNRTMSRVQRNKAIGRRMVARAGLSRSHWRCLNRLWARESGWNHRSHNSGSGAHGIPQALPGSKMASAGRDWQSNPETQIKWGLRYIKARYGTPCAAWSHFSAVNWY